MKLEFDCQEEVGEGEEVELKFDCYFHHKWVNLELERSC